MAIIDKFSFLFLLFFIRTNSEEPLLVRSPPIREASVIVLFRYNSVIITLAPQFGIRPIRLVMNGDSSLFVNNVFDIKLSPSKVNIIFSIRVIMNIKMVILMVCFIDDNMMLWLQLQCSSSHIW